MISQPKTPSKTWMPYRYKLLINSNGNRSKCSVNTFLQRHPTWLSIISVTTKKSTKLSTSLTLICRLPPRGLLRSIGWSTHCLKNKCTTSKLFSNTWKSKSMGTAILSPQPKDKQAPKPTNLWGPQVKKTNCLATNCLRIPQDTGSKTSIKSWRSCKFNWKRATSNQSSNTTTTLV